MLRDVNLDVARGETLVLTGATGSGKTTLLHLVPRLADVTGGRVLLGGTDVRDIPLPAAARRGGLRVRGGDAVLRRACGRTSRSARRTRPRRRSRRR